MFRISSRSKLVRLILSTVIPATALILSAQAQEKGNTTARQDTLPISFSLPASTKEQDGLIGPVRQVRTERAELSMKSGKLTEGPRSLLSTTVYNPQGNSIDNTYYLVTERNRGVGKEEYKYDDKGNVTEVTLRDNHGGILSRELYRYEFDLIGNWNKMVASLVIYEGGKLTHEPVEVTYRNISYYFTEPIAKGDNSSQSDEISKSRSIVPRGTTVNSGPATNSRPTGSRTTGSQELDDPLVIKADGDLSEVRMPKPQAILFSDGAPNNQVIRIANATYPDEAKRAGVTGTVVVLVEIDTEGKVVSARAVRGHATLRAAAVEAALKARFSPTLRTNQTSKRSGVISFTFSLIQ